MTIKQYVPVQLRQYSQRIYTVLSEERMVPTVLWIHSPEKGCSSCTALRVPRRQSLPLPSARFAVAGELKCPFTWRSNTACRREAGSW